MVDERHDRHHLRHDTTVVEHRRERTGGGVVSPGSVESGPRHGDAERRVVTATRARRLGHHVALHNRDSRRIRLTVPRELGDVALARLRRFLLRTACTLTLRELDHGPFDTLNEQIEAGRPGRRSSRSRSRRSASVAHSSPRRCRSPRAASPAKSWSDVSTRAARAYRGDWCARTVRARNGSTRCCVRRVRRTPRA